MADNFSRMVACGAMAFALDLNGWAEVLVAAPWVAIMVAYAIYVYVGVK